MYVLEVMSGALDGKRWPFEREIVIGRDPALATAAVPIDGAVSRRHAKVSARDGELVLADLQSSNGTIVDGAAIASPLRISPGQPFRVGRTMIRVIAPDGQQG